MTSDAIHLFAVCLGGRASGCNVELHDVVFAVGTSVENCHRQLLDAWFGLPLGMHIDAWCRLDGVDGYRVVLDRKPARAGPRLYFVNIGGYAPGEFGERHAFGFYAGRDKAEVKRRAKAERLAGKQAIHRDDLLNVDDVLTVDPGRGWHVQLVPDPTAPAPEIVNGYFPIPRATIEAWKAARPGAY